MPLRINSASRNLDRAYLKILGDVVIVRYRSQQARLDLGDVVCEPLRSFGLLAVKGGFVDALQTAGNAAVGQPRLSKNSPSDYV